MVKWLAYSQVHCLKFPSIKLTSISIEIPETSVEVDIPAQYLEYAEVFSKAKAPSLPPHRPYECVIDLLPGSTPPRGHIYPLSEPEQKAIEYIQGALRQVYIRSSTSTALVAFFFVEKKGGGLRPCIDYRGPNQISVKYPYPLPLVPAAVEQLQEAVIFTKLDLRSTYNLVRILEGDEWKTVCSTSCGHYEYLVMLYGPSCTPSVFQHLIDDILGKMLAKFVIIYIAFYCYKKLTPTKCNSLETESIWQLNWLWNSGRTGWRGLQIPLLYIDHKNLEYLKTVKRLNPRNARGTLFFSRFNFMVCNRPGSQDTKADALSCRQAEQPGANVSDTILPVTCFVNVVRLEIRD